jgi:RNA polymerase sigma factor for flagellar operon FliA
MPNLFWMVFPIRVSPQKGHILSAHVYQQVGGDQQREDLILGNLSLVRHILGRLAVRLPRGTDLDNLEAAGVLGLVEAANRYEPERGIPFRTFAYTRIRGAILDELRRNSPLPQELLEKIARIRKVLQLLPPPVSVEVLAEKTNLTEDDIADCFAAMRLTRNVSWNDIMSSQNGQLVGGERPEDRMELAERKRLLAEAITRLPENERLAVTLYYMEDLRLKEIGQVLHLSESRVCRLLKSAEFRLEENIRAREENLTHAGHLAS